MEKFKYNPEKFIISFVHYLASSTVFHKFVSPTQKDLPQQVPASLLPQSLNSVNPPVGQRPDY